MFAHAEKLIAAQRLSEAVDFCRAQLQGSPRCVTLRVLLARALMARGERAAAAAPLQECLRIDPSSTAGRSLLDEIEERERRLQAARIPPPPLPRGAKPTPRPAAPRPLPKPELSVKQGTTRAAALASCY